jgi:hypothetical protein
MGFVNAVDPNPTRFLAELSMKEDIIIYKL